MCSVAEGSQRGVGQHVQSAESPESSPTEPHMILCSQAPARVVSCLLRLKNCAMTLAKLFGHWDPQAPALLCSFRDWENIPSGSSEPCRRLTRTSKYLVLFLAQTEFSTNMLTLFLSHRFTERTPFYLRNHFSFGLSKVLLHS